MAKRNLGPLSRLILGGEKGSLRKKGRSCDWEEGQPNLSLHTNSGCV